MIAIEYLVKNDQKKVKCGDIESFEHLLLSDNDIKIQNNKIKFQHKLEIGYQLEAIKIPDSNSVCFHIWLSVDTVCQIELFTNFLRSIKKIFFIFTESPEILADGISQYYASQAYPLLYEIENIMRKLLTKFMLLNVGLNWSSDNVPDDVKNSIKNSDETTFLHNIDFIQLKHFLFSEKYTSNKDKLIDKLKKSNDLTNISLEDIKSLIPISNWNKYFSDEIDIKESELIKNWDELYNLRCKVAHNKSFSKQDYDKVTNLISKTKPALEKAIDNLDNIKMSERSRSDIKEEVTAEIATSEYTSEWLNLIEIGRKIIQSTEVIDRQSKPPIETIIVK